MARNDQKAPEALKKLSLIRQVLIPAIQAGMAITTTTGEPVTLDNLPLLMRLGARVVLTDPRDGRLIAATVADDDPAQIPVTPAFVQVRPDGRTVRFYLWDDLSVRAAHGYQPEPLHLGDDLLNVCLNKRGMLLRDATCRTAGKLMQSGKIATATES